MTQPEPLLQVEGLKTHFFLDEGTVRAVDGVDLTVTPGTIVCVVGESGCGKSITARSILGLVESPGRVVDGHIWWDPALAGAGANGSRPVQELSSQGRRTGRRRSAADRGRVDLTALDSHSEKMRQIRGNEISMIFQEPMASLSPMYTVAAQLTEAIRLHLPLSKQEAFDHGVSLLKRVGIPRPEQRMHAYPFQLSGGMCQRVMIAIALACSPSLLIADEPTTALDVTTQARIIDLLTELQAETGMAVLFITHDMGVVAEIADEVVVMYLGTVVERGSVDEIFHDPKHPYTQGLLRSIPTMGLGGRQRLTSIQGQVPHPLDRPRGCPYHPRCDQAVAGLCDASDPPTVNLDHGRRVRCVLYDGDMRHDQRAAAAPAPRADPGNTEQI
jgi:peptide/nickel transport system ATP-binding protein